MLKIILSQGLIILILLIYSSPVSGMNIAGAGCVSSGYYIGSGEPAQAEITTGESAGARSNPGLGAAAVNYYSIVYDKEYFYRENNSQPIRDYRYYNVKTIVPPVKKKNYVLRDFRRDLWENKTYK
jgi:hypothetical protein